MLFTGGFTPPKGVIYIRIREQLFNLGLYKGKNLPEIPDRLKSFYENQIRKWQDIYTGQPDWKYVSKGGLSGGFRKLNCMNVASALCHEFAALCFSQQVDFNMADKKIKKFIEDTLQENDFWSCFPVFLEKVFALGSGVVKLYTENEKIKLDYIGCDLFIPTQYNEKGVFGGVILSRTIKEKDTYMLMEHHEKTTSGYRITNTLYKCDSGGGSGIEVPLNTLYPDLSPSTEIKGLSKPLFVYFRTSKANSKTDNGIGMSVFADAQDTLKSLDIIFDSLQREFVLGKKRIIVPTSAIRGEYDEKGKKHRYFDTNDEVYQAFTPNDNESLQIVDNSVQLRINEHLTAIQGLLDILCMQVGLSQGTLSYHSGTVRTATEVISQNSKTYRTKTAHQQLIREGLHQLCGNIFLLGKMLGHINPNAEMSLSIAFSDSVMQDNSAKIDNAVKLFSAGIISKERALMEIYGLTREETDEY